MRTTLTEFQRNFRKAREAADRGDSVIVTGENGSYVFERRAAVSDYPFAGLEGVFGAVTLPQDNAPLREKVRRRLVARTDIVSLGARIERVFDDIQPMGAAHGFCRCLRRGARSQL